jgi:membrane-bound serine protease (ClpP class)
VRLAFPCFLVLLLLAPAAGADVLKIVVADLIHPITDEFIARAIEEAKSKGDEALLIELRTPGGLETSTRQIVNRMLASPVPIIVYVAPSGSRAASAGFFLLQAADIAAMAPATNTGAAHPVVIGVEKIDEIMKKKMEEDSAAFMRSIVAKRGRNVAVAESAVLQSKSFTEQEALQQKLIDLVAPDEQSLLRQIDGRSFNRFNGEEFTLQLSQKRVRTMEMTLRQKLLAFIMDPNVAFILFSLGMLALWAEFNNPGAILPGVVGLICLVLAVFALNILPTRYAALALILLGFVLFALEAKYTSKGILGAAGIAALFMGGLLLVDSPVPEMRVHWITALAVSVPFGIIAVFLASLVVRAYRTRVVTGEQGLIGEIGVVRTPLAPEGKIFVHGELWNAVAPSRVEPGARVRVRRIDGLLLEVEPVEP